MPDWAWAAYAIGVGVGTLGAIGFIMRKWWAPLAFAFSLIAILIQFSYSFLIAQGAQTDIAMRAFPMFIVVMAVIQWQLSRQIRKQAGPAAPISRWPVAPVRRFYSMPTGCILSPKSSHGLRRIARMRSALRTVTETRRIK